MQTKLIGACTDFKEIWVSKYTRPVGLSVASLTADPGLPSSIPAQSQTSMDIDLEIISTVIFLLPLIQEGLLSVTS